MNDINIFLIAAGVLSISAALLHLGIIIGGANWYRFFGAGEKMARMAEQGSWYPTIVTLIIACVLFIWGLYAFSGAGLLPVFPLLKFVLIAISAIYLLRGLVFLPVRLYLSKKVDGFSVWSSLVSFLLGLFYAVGTTQEWLNL